MTLPLKLILNNTNNIPTESSNIAEMLTAIYTQEDIIIEIMMYRIRHMQTRNRIFDDLAKVANSAFGTVSGIKEELEQMIRHRVESFINSMNLVSREEFEVTQAMVTKAREHNEDLEKRIVRLEKNLKAQKARTTAKTGRQNKSK